MVSQLNRNRVDNELPSKRNPLTLLSSHDNEVAPPMPTANEVDITNAEYGFLNPDTCYRADALNFFRGEIVEDTVVCDMLFDLASMNLHPSNAHRRDEATIRIICRLSALVREQAAQENLPRTRETYL